MDHKATALDAWKPTRLVAKQNEPDENKQTEELFKNVRGILNKLTPLTFDTLMKKFQLLPINSEDRLKGVVNLIYEKAVNEPMSSMVYANMCKLCSKLEVSKVENGQEQKVNFRKFLVTRCQTEFERNYPDELNSTKCLEEIQNCSDPDKKKEMQLQYAEREKAIQRKILGNTRFIGELFKLYMLTPAIMYRCIEGLLNTPTEESLECLCELLTVIGKELEFGTIGAKGPQVSLNPYFQKMSDLAQRREGSKVSSRVRFMLQDVIELRHNKWIPRRKEDINTVYQDWWNATQSSPRHYYTKFFPAFEAPKMMHMVKSDVDLNSLSLGGNSMFRFNTAAKTAETKPNASFTSSNLYSALSRGEGRGPPPTQPLNSRRTPRVEREEERQQMIQGALASTACDWLRACELTTLVTEQDEPDEDKQTEELFENVRGILNKLTPLTFDTLMKKFQLLPINSEDRLKGVVNLIFEKAVDEPRFSKVYANMCNLCSKLEVSKLENGQEQKVNFRKILITRCQTEFERNNADKLNAAKCLEEIQNCSDPEKKKELQLKCTEKERVIQTKRVGSIRFIGELFNLNMLTPAIMFRCIDHLLNTPTEESLECLCELLTVIGKELEFGTIGAKGPLFLINSYFQKISDLAQKQEDSNVSSSVRILLRDVIELRHNKWVPRTEDTMPKTIHQTNKEAEKESGVDDDTEPPGMNQQNERPDARRIANFAGVPDGRGAAVEQLRDELS